jgi:SET domain-containing protein
MASVLGVLSERGVIIEHTLAREATRSAVCPVSSGMPSDAPDLPFEIRPSAMQGMGAYATRAIPSGVRLIEYAGERLTPAEADARYPDVEGERHHTFLFAIDDDVVIDAAVNGNAARFINHSCDPNCDAVIDDGRIWIETIRDVAPGEELAYDYAYVLEERHTPAAKRRFPCHCGAATCRGTILAKKR